MADLLGVEISARFRNILTIVAVVSVISVVATGWAVMGARTTALEVADVVLHSADARIELAQERTNLIALDNQQALAAIDAKIDILLGDRHRPVD